MNDATATSKAFAICKAQMKEDIESNTEEKVNEDGHIIVAENVKILLDAEISTIEE